MDVAAFIPPPSTGILKVRFRGSMQAASGGGHLSLTNGAPLTLLVVYSVAR